MKRVIIVFCCILCSVSLFAQKKGDFTLGASASVSFLDNAGVILMENTVFRFEYVDAPTLTLGASIEVGYFLFKGFRVALSAGYAQQRNIADHAGNLTGTNSYAFVFGPSLAYFLRLFPGLYYVPEVGGGYAIGRSTYRNDVDDIRVSVKMQGYSISVNLLSLEYKPTDRIGIAISLGQFSYSYLAGEDTANHFSAQSMSGGFVFNSNSTVGVRFYL